MGEFGGITPALLAWVVPGFVVDVVRVVLSALGAVLAWFIAAPMARGLVRLFLRRPLGEVGQFFSRIGGAAAAALLIYFFLPLHLGTGGSGGPGPGDGPGEGKGRYAKGKNDKNKTDKNGKTGKDKNGNSDTPTRLTILVIGGSEYKGDKKAYRLESKDPDVKLADVEKYIETHKDKIKQVHIVRSREFKEAFVTDLTEMLRKNYPKLLYNVEDAGDAKESSWNVQPSQVDVGQTFRPDASAWKGRPTT